MPMPKPKSTKDLSVSGREPKKLIRVEKAFENKENPDTYIPDVYNRMNELAEAAKKKAEEEK